MLTRDRIIPTVIVWFIVIAASALPLLWMIAQVVLNCDVLVETRLDAFRLQLLGRTLLYNISAGVIATILALPVAVVLGRGRGWWVGVLWFVLPAALLVPSITYAYGWSQFVRLTRPFWLELFGVSFAPASPSDVFRCIWSLAGWLWPIPAGLIGLSLLRADTSVQQQALLDGALGRITARLLAGPVIASIAIASVLALQEFSVYEPTGISVVATEVRMVFDTGAFGSSTNPMNAPIISERAASDGVTNGDITADSSRDVFGRLRHQRARAAAALATAIPLLLVIALLATIAFFAIGGSNSLSGEIDIGPWPRALEAGAVARVLAIVVTALMIGIPFGALIVSLQRDFDPMFIWKQFSPQVTGSLLVATLTGLVALILALAACATPVRLPIWIALATFLIGGQLLAIAQIRLYNSGWLNDVVYNGPPIVMLAYLSRFGWISLAAARSTWSKPWRELREQAAVDGAGATRTLFHVIGPIAIPLLGASAVLVAILSLTEVPATVLLAPQRPQLLTPMLMTWVHMLRYDAMIEGALLMAAIVLVATAVAVVLTRYGLRVLSNRKGAFLFCLLTGAFCSCLPGCDLDNSSPDAVWGSRNGLTLIYPRAIDYAPGDDTFFVIDRSAVVQHIDRRGRVLAEWRMPESATGKPVGVSIGPDGNVYVPDTHYHRVIVYDVTGDEIRRWGTQGTEPGQFIYPTDIAFDQKGNVFVSEYGDHDRVQVFKPDGTYLYEFGSFGQGDGQFSRPESMVIDGDHIYITDECNHRLVVFKTDGTWVRNMGGPGDGLGEFRFPKGLAMDSEGRLIVCEFGNNRIQLVDKETGKGLAFWGAGGHEPGQLAYPWGVAVDREDRIVTVDSGNNRLQVFEF